MFVFFSLCTPFIIHSFHSLSLNSADRNKYWIWFKANFILFQRIGIAIHLTTRYFAYYIQFSIPTKALIQHWICMKKLLNKLWKLCIEVIQHFDYTSKHLPILLQRMRRIKNKNHEIRKYLIVHKHKHILKDDSG